MGLCDVRAGDDLFVQDDREIVEGLLVVVGVPGGKIGKDLRPLVGQLKGDAELARVGIAVGVADLGGCR